MWPRGLKAAAQVCGHMTWVWYGEAWLTKAQTLSKYLVLSCGEKADHLTRDCDYGTLPTNHECVARI